MRALFISSYWPRRNFIKREFPKCYCYVAKNIICIESFCGGKPRDWQVCTYTHTYICVHYKATCVSTVSIYILLYFTSSYVGRNKSTTWMVIKRNTSVKFLVSYIIEKFYERYSWYSCWQNMLNYFPLNCSFYKVI